MQCDWLLWLISLTRRQGDHLRHCNNTQPARLTIGIHILSTIPYWRVSGEESLAMMIQVYQLIVLDKAAACLFTIRKHFAGVIAGWWRTKFRTYDRCEIAFDGYYPVDTIQWIVVLIARYPMHIHVNTIQDTIQANIFCECFDYL